jgi:hypothetical protein
MHIKILHFQGKETRVLLMIGTMIYNTRIVITVDSIEHLIN